MASSHHFCAYCEELLAGPEHARLHLTRCHPETSAKGAMLHLGPGGVPIITVRVWPASLRAQEGFGMFQTVWEN